MHTPSLLPIALPSHQHTITHMHHKLTLHATQHLSVIQSLCSLRGLDGMHFAFVPMTLARAVTVGTVLGYTVIYTVRYTTGS